jgi:hypothetical protein
MGPCVEDKLGREKPEQKHARGHVVFPYHDHEPVIHAKIQEEIGSQQFPVSSKRDLEDKIIQAFEAEETEKYPKENTVENGFLFDLNKSEPVDRGNC